MTWHYRIIIVLYAYYHDSVVSTCNIVHYLWLDRKFKLVVSKENELEIKYTALHHLRKAQRK